MSMTLEEAIIHAEEVANDYEEMIGDYALDSEKLAKCAKNQRQIAAWLRELAERRKAPEIVRCGECVNFSERDFCKVAGHNVHRKSNCMKVFGAERRTDK